MDEGPVPPDEAVRGAEAGRGEKKGKTVPGNGVKRPARLFIEELVTARRAGVRILLVVEVLVVVQLVLLLLLVILVVIALGRLLGALDLALEDLEQLVVELVLLRDQVVELGQDRGLPLVDPVHLLQLLPDFLLAVIDLARDLPRIPTRIQEGDILRTAPGQLKASGMCARNKKAFLPSHLAVLLLLGMELGHED